MTYPVPSSAVETTTPPASEPVSLAVAKAQCRVEHDADNALFIGDGTSPGWIAAARQLVETGSNLRLLTQTVAMTFDGFPDCGRPLQLPLAPVQSVGSVTYRDADGVTRTLTGFGVWLAKRPPLVGAPATGWPATACDGMAAVTVTAVVGWASVALVPAQAVQAMLLILGYWNSFRGDGKDPQQYPQLVGIPAGAQRLIDQLTRREYR